MLIPVTSWTTVMEEPALNPPSTVVAVIEVLPGATAVTSPPAETVAIAGLPVIHVKLWLVAFAGWTEGESW